MTETLLPLGVICLFILSVLNALACYSLRDFSRSRLDEICQTKNNASRFGEILNQQEATLLAAEILFYVLLLGLISTLFVVLDFSIPSTGSFTEWIVLSGKWILVAFILVTTLGILPWTLSRVTGELFLYRAWPFLKAMTFVMQPKLKIIHLIDKFAHRLSGMQEPHETDESVLAEEIRSVVDEGQREGLLESGAGTMIHRVMELQEEDTAAIMTPRTEMNCISVGSTLEDARRQLLEAGHSRMPVIGETTDDVIGILYAKDLLKQVNNLTETDIALKEILREPFYVPETTGIANLLETMKRKHIHLAIVVDEYGGVAGLVTMEDVLEEIVGEIVDEFDAAEETGIQTTGPNSTEVEARVHIDDLNEQFDYGLPEDSDYDTIGGFVFTQLGRVPEVNDNFTWNQLRITVLDADKRKIGKLRIEVDQSLTETSPENT